MKAKSLSKKLSIAILFFAVFTVNAWGQVTSRFVTTLRNSAGAVITGRDVELRLSGVLQYQLTEITISRGSYFHDTVPHGLYQLYVDGVQNVIAPTIFHGAQQISNVVNHFDASGDVGAVPTFSVSTQLTAVNVKITGGTPGTGKVLTSDADGEATWQAGGGGASDTWQRVGTEVELINTGDSVAIGNTNALEKLHVSSTTTNTTVLIETINTNGLATANLSLYKNDSNPGANDFIGGIGFTGNNSLPAQVSYGTILATSPTVTDNVEDGKLAFLVLLNGVSHNYFEIDGENDRIEANAPSMILSSGATSTELLSQVDNTNALASAAVGIYKNDTNPGAGDILGGFTFSGNNAVPEKVQFGAIVMTGETLTDNVEDGRMSFLITKDGSGFSYFELDAENDLIKASAPDFNLTSTTTNTNLLVEAVNTNNLATASIQLYKNDSNPTAGNFLSGITFQGNNSIPALFDFASIVATSPTVTAAGEDGKLSFLVALNGNPATFLELDGELDQVEATASKFSLNAATPAQFVHFRNTELTSILLVENENTSNLASANLKLYKDDSSPTADNLIAGISFDGNNSTPAQVNFAAIAVTSPTVTTTAEDGKLVLLVTVNGSGEAFLTLDGANNFVQINKPLQIPTGASNGFVLTSDASGNATWQAAGGGSGDITDVGPAFASGAAFVDGTASSGTTMLIWEGTTVDLNELNLISPSSNPGADINITFPSATGTLTTTSDNLGSFSSTTSAQLATVLSNEIGTGSFLLDTNPTITTPTISGAITFPDGVRQLFNPDGTTPGINIGSFAGDPSTPSDGDMWYNSTTQRFMSRENSVNVTMITNANNVGIQRISTKVHLINTGDQVQFGDITTFTGKIHFNHTSGNPLLLLENFSETDAAGAELVLIHNEGTTNAGEEAGIITFRTKEGTGVVDFGSVALIADDVNSGTGDAHFEFSAKLAGSLEKVFQVYGDRTIEIFNNDNTGISDYVGRIDFNGTNDVPAQLDYGRIQVESTDISDQLGRMSFFLTNGGTLGEVLRLNHDLTATLFGAVAFPDNIRQTFNPGANNAGINVGSLSGDPSTPSNGDIFYQSTANELRARINGAWVALGAGGGSGDITDVGPAFASGAAFTDGVVSTGTSMFIWEGTTANTNELTIISPSADPGADINLTLPSATGNILMRTGTLTNGGLLLGTATDEVRSLGVATNGQIPIGDGTTDPVLATITGTSQEITVTNAAGSITLSVPDVFQEIFIPAGFVNPGAGDLLGAGLLSDHPDNTNDFTLDGVDLSGTAEGWTSTFYPMPPDWNGSTAPKFKVVSYSNSSHASNTANYEMRTGYVRPGTDSWVAALGSLATVNQTYVTANVVYESSTISPTPAGTAAAGAWIKINTMRDGDDGTNDTFNNTTVLIGYKMRYLKNIYGTTTDF